MTYTQWNQTETEIGIASSSNLRDWVKHGPAFGRTRPFEPSAIRRKSGAVVTRLDGDRRLAARHHGLYWMYWGVGIYWRSGVEESLKIGIRCLIRIGPTC